MPDDQRAWDAIAQMPITHGTSPATPKTAADLVQEVLASKAGIALPDEAKQRLLKAATEERPIEEPATNVIKGDFQRGAVSKGDILIPQYDIRGSMGHGQVPAEYAEFVRNLVVSAPQLEKLGLEYTSPANLSVISGWGQSMAPTIQDKDPVIVDRGITEFVGDGVYVLTWNDHLFIKRLAMAGGGKLKVISDSRPHDPEPVDPDEIHVHARVLYVWNGKKV